MGLTGRVASILRFLTGAALVEVGGGVGGLLLDQLQERDRDDCVGGLRGEVGRRSRKEEGALDQRGGCRSSGGGC